MPLKVKGGLLIITQEGSCKTGRPCANQNMWLITLHHGGNRSSWKGSNLSKATQLSQVEKLPQPEAPQNQENHPLTWQLQSKAKVTLSLSMFSFCWNLSAKAGWRKTQDACSKQNRKEKRTFWFVSISRLVFYCYNPSLFYQISLGQTHTQY